MVKKDTSEEKDLHESELFFETPYEPLKVKEIFNPSTISMLIHDQKSQILNELFYEQKSIMQLNKSTGLNPGTIKRHIEELKEAGLIVDSFQELNNKRILVKFYRVAAQKFIFHYEWP